MKKIFLFVVLVLCGMTFASAQDFEKIRFGVTAGANMSKNNASNAKNKFGFKAGVRGEYNFSETMYLGADLIYDQKGCKYDPTPYGEISMGQSYISLPIHFGYRYSVSESICLFGEAGPYFAYGIAGKTSADDGDEEPNTFGDGDDEMNIKRFDAGIGVRFGVEYRKFQLHVGYDYGLTGIAKDDHWFFEDKGSDYKNQNFYVGVAYMF